MSVYTYCIHLTRILELPAARARAAFLDLVKKVVTDRVERVVIDHRHLPGRAVLVSEAYLDRLGCQAQAHERPVNPLRLIGSATPAPGTDVTSVLTEIRADAAHRIADKLETL